MAAILLNTILFLVSLCWCFQINPEKVEVVYKSSKYVSNVSVYLTSGGKNMPNRLSIDGRNKHTWSNNITINFVLYDYVHNQYRRSYVGFSFKLCDMINKDRYIGAMVAKAGITCPVAPAFHCIRNMTVPYGGDFKYVWGMKKCMVQFGFAITGTSELVAKVNIFLSMLG